MSLKVTIDNVAREIPQVGDTDWGEPTTELLNSMVSAIHKRSKLSGDETLTGTKTFADPPVVPEPTHLSHPVRKQDLNNYQDSINTLQSRMATADTNISTLTQSMRSVEESVQDHSTQINTLRTNLNDTNSTLNFLVPIGTILPLHPYASFPNSDYWRFCNGAAKLGSNFGNYHDTNIPNLTDTFLMGGSSHGTGGTNSKTLNSLNIPNHVHGMNHTHNEFDTNSAGGHSHQVTYLRSAEIRSSSSGSVSRFWLHSGTSSGSSSRETNTVAAHQHRVYIPEYVGQTGSMIGGHSQSFDNRPKYFRVRYYIRVA